MKVRNGKDKSYLLMTGNEKQESLLTEKFRCILTSNNYRSPYPVAAGRFQRQRSIQTIFTGAQTYRAPVTLSPVYCLSYIKLEIRKTSIPLERALKALVWDRRVEHLVRLKWRSTRASGRYVQLMFSSKSSLKSDLLVIHLGYRRSRLFVVFKVGTELHTISMYRFYLSQGN